MGSLHGHISWRPYPQRPVLTHAKPGQTDDGTTVRSCGAWRAYMVTFHAGLTSRGPCPPVSSECANPICRKEQPRLHANSETQGVKVNRHPKGSRASRLEHGQMLACIPDPTRDLTVILPSQERYTQTPNGILRSSCRRMPGPAPIDREASGLTVILP